jgi:tartrate-resistant acid phosphatase type 5
VFIGHLVLIKYIGNHDYGFGLSGISAQIDRTTSGDDDLWTMPSTNYTQIFSIGGGATLQIVFIDTTTLAPSENSCCNENGGVSVSEQSTRIASQLSNIIAILEKASIHKPTWLLVAGHYPVYSSGSHSDTQELISYLDPLLSKYNVHAYFSGNYTSPSHMNYLFQIKYRRPRSYLRTLTKGWNALLRVGSWKYG